MKVKTLVMLAMAFIAGVVQANGVPLKDATVVVPDGYYKGRYLQNDAAGAILDLTNALAKVTGGKYQVVRESQCKTSNAIADSQSTFIYLGDQAASRAAGVADDSLKNCEAKVLVKDGKVYIWAKTEWGVTRGVIEFLRRSVDYWYLTLSGDDPFVYNPNAVAPAGGYTVGSWLQDYTVYHAMFSNRRYPETKQKWVDYSRRLGTYHQDGTDPKYKLSSRTRQGHSTFDYLKPDKYFKDHPEYFALRDEGGKLHRSAAASAGGQICYTNPDTRRICYEALRNYVIEDRRQFGENAPTIYDFSQQDFSCGKLCLCTNCLEAAAKYDRDGGYKNGGNSGLQLEMINEMARKIRKEFPEVYIRTFAYAATEIHPVNIEPEENVIIFVCDFCNTDAMYPLTSPVNKARKAYMDSWGLTAKRLHIWDYFIYGWGGDEEYPKFYGDAVAADMRLFQNYPLEWIFWESEYHDRAFHELNYFVASEVTREPSKSVDKLVHIYCRVYGKAAAKMEGVITWLRKVMRENPPEKDNRRPWLTVANMEKMRDDLLSAYAAAATPVTKARVAKVVACCEFYLAEQYQKRGRRDDAERSRTVFKRYEKEHTALCVMESKDRRAALESGIDERADVNSLRFKRLPPELEAAPAEDLFCLDNRSLGTMFRVQDAAAENGKAGTWGKGKAKEAFQGFPIGCGLYSVRRRSVVTDIST